MRTLKTKILILALLIASEGQASAQKLGYSGRFANADGSPVTGPVNVTVEILTGTTGSETTRCMSFINGLSLSNGVFNVELDFATTCDSNAKTLAQVLKPAFTDSTYEPVWIRLTTTNTSPAVVYGPSPVYATPVSIYALSAPIELQSVEDTHLKGIGANCSSGQMLQSDGSGGFSCVAAPSGGSVGAQTIDDLKLKGISANCSSGQILQANGSGGFSCAAAPSGGSGDITAVIAGTGISVSGGASGDATVSHADNSSVADSTNTNGVVVQSLGFDDLGHVDAISTVDLDGRYMQSVANQSLKDTHFSGISSNCSNGQVLAADGSGNFSCSSVSGGSGDITAVIAGTGISVSGGASGDATVSHADNSSVADSTNTNGIVVQSLGFDDLGHVDAISTVDLDSRYLQSVAAQSVDDLKLKGITANCTSGQMLQSDGAGGFSCVAAPSGGGGSGDITAVLAGAGITVTGGDTGDATVAHADTSSALSVNYSNGTVIQDITLDTYGHITALVGIDLDNRYLLRTGGSLTGALSTSSTIAATGNITSSANVNAVAFLYTSDRRKKENIEDIHGKEALRLVRELQGVHFNWIDGGKKDIGFIAQDVQKVVPELVQEVNDQDGNNYLAVQYGNIVAIAVEAIKEQNRQIASDKKRIEELEKQNKEMQKKLDLILEKLSK